MKRRFFRNIVWRSSLEVKANVTDTEFLYCVLMIGNRILFRFPANEFSGNILCLCVCVIVHKSKMGVQEPMYEQVIQVSI